MCCANCSTPLSFTTFQPVRFRGGGGTRPPPSPKLYRTTYVLHPQSNHHYALLEFLCPSRRIRRTRRRRRAVVQRALRVPKQVCQNRYRFGGFIPVCLLVPLLLALGYGRPSQYPIPFDFISLISVLFVPGRRRGPSSTFASPGLTYSFPVFCVASRISVSRVTSYVVHRRYLDEPVLGSSTNFHSQRCRFNDFWRSSHRFQHCSDNFGIFPRCLQCSFDIAGRGDQFLRTVSLVYVDEQCTFSVVH